MSNAWIGVDLDKTLAYYDGWKGRNYIGHPIPLMVGRVKRWLEEGRQVRIFTARASEMNFEEELAIKSWCSEHIGRVLPITCKKDFDCIAIFDDLATAIEPNTGEYLSPPPKGL